jgi:predicted transcriptional regulator
MNRLTSSLDNTVINVAKRAFSNARTQLVNLAHVTATHSSNDVGSTVDASNATFCISTKYIVINGIINVINNIAFHVEGRLCRASIFSTLVVRLCASKTKKKKQNKTKQNQFTRF